MTCVLARFLDSDDLRFSPLCYSICLIDKTIIILFNHVSIRDITLPAFYKGMRGLDRKRRRRKGNGEKSGVEGFGNEKVRGRRG